MTRKVSPLGTGAVEWLGLRFDCEDPPVQAAAKRDEATASARRRRPPMPRSLDFAIPDVNAPWHLSQVTGVDGRDATAAVDG